MKRLMDSNKMSGLLVIQNTNTTNPIGGRQSFSYYWSQVNLCHEAVKDK